MKKLVPPLLLALAIGLVVGFFVGMEYKAYQVRSAFKQAVSDTTSTSPSDTSMMATAKKENYQIIEKSIGDEITLATLKFKVNKADEKQTISSSYGSPKVAKANSKFIVLDLTVTNTTSSPFTLAPDEGFRLVDNNQREFKTYSDSIGSIDNYLNYKELAPGVPQNGVLVYEVPSDATTYSLTTSKGGTTELYRIKLK